jgi:hypothetical protein
MKWILLILLGFTPHASAFWGPKTFEECVLDKMKGQDRSMLPTARRACRKIFPVEEMVAVPDFTWDVSPNGKGQVKVTSKPQGYRLSRVEGVIFTKTCDEPQTESGVKVAATRSRFSDTFDFQVAADRQYGCARFIFWGFEE